MSEINIAVMGRDAGTTEFMTKLAGVSKESADSHEQWTFTTRVDGQEFGVSVSSPHWGMREGVRRMIIHSFIH